MQIEWQNVSAILIQLTKSYLNQPEMPEFGMRDLTYERFKASVSRDIAPADVAGLQAAQAAWPAAAVATLGGPLGQGEIHRALQVKNGGHNQWRAAANEMAQGDVVEAIVHTVTRDPVVARLQIVALPASCGMALEALLVGLLSTSPAVKQWKVMHPAGGASGTESMVAYLRMPLTDGQTGGLVAALSHVLHGRLDDLNPPPLGLQRLAAGIFGCDVPTGPEQTNILGIAAKRHGSAGTIIASLLCKAAFTAASRREVAIVDPATMNDQAFAAYCRDALTDCARELGWTVV